MLAAFYTRPAVATIVFLQKGILNERELLPSCCVHLWWSMLTGAFIFTGFSHKRLGVFGSPIYHRQNRSPLQAVCSELQYWPGKEPNLLDIPATCSPKYCFSLGMCPGDLHKKLITVHLSDCISSQNSEPMVCKALKVIMNSDHVIRYVKRIWHETDWHF